MYDNDNVWKYRIGCSKTIFILNFLHVLHCKLNLLTSSKICSCFFFMRMGARGPEATQEAKFVTGQDTIMLNQTYIEQQITASA